jgi:succinyl-diaminopimelate desuccinylase
MSQTLELAQALIARPSVTPDDAGCQALIAARLRPLGFAIEAMVSGEVENLWARRGNERPLLVFAGHTDVVPAGPREDWASDPFSPTIRDGLLFGRGAADMKGGLAAMVTAIERFVAAQPRHRGSIAMLLTSDEEGPSIDGTVKVVEKLESRGEKLDWCLVGEPSSEEHIGDTVKIGRRGSLNGVLRFRGVQGHVAYPQHARNPIHCVLPALAELVASEWDRGNDHFPPTGFQISNIHAGTGAENVIPGTIEVMFNLRFSTAQTAADLQARVAESLERRGLYGEIDWRLSGNPFLTPAGDLIDATRRAVRSITGAEPRLSTSGGTSDGRFIAPTGAQVVELGLLNTTIHKVDECVPVADLDILSRIYEQLLANLIAG